MNKDEPETALEYLKKVDETLVKMESQRISNDNSYSYNSNKLNQNKSTEQTNSNIDSNYKAALYYNLACCY